MQNLESQEGTADYGTCTREPAPNAVGLLFVGPGVTMARHACELEGGFDIAGPLVVGGTTRAKLWSRKFTEGL